jgi:hypothetical protein
MSFAAHKLVLLSNRRFRRLQFLFHYMLTNQTTTTMNRPAMMKNGRSVRFSDFTLERVQIIHQTIDERLEMNPPECSDALCNISPLRTFSNDGIYTKSKMSFTSCNDLSQREPRKLAKKRDELDNSNHDRKPVSTSWNGDLDTSNHQRRDRHVPCY